MLVEWFLVLILAQVSVMLHTWVLCYMYRGSRLFNLCNPVDRAEYVSMDGVSTDADCGEDSMQGSYIKWKIYPLPFTELYSGWAQEAGIADRRS